MAQANAPRGFTPVGTLNGSPWTDSIRPFLCPTTDATAIYVGDAVKSGGTAGAAGTVVYGINCEGMSTVAVAAAGNTMVGVVVGFSPLQTDLTKLHRAASEARIAYVVTDPNAIYEVQESASADASSIAVTAVGNNFDHVNTAGSATTGRSAQVLDSTDASGTATAGFRLLGLAPKVGNVLGGYAKWHVVINEHEFKTTTGV